MTARTLRRPLGGWGARRWRAEVRAWLVAAVLYLMAGASTNLVYKTIDFVAAEVVATSTNL